MERLLEENSDEGQQQISSGRRITIKPTSITTRIVLSGNSLENAVKAIAIINIGIGLIFLIGNIMLLFLLISYPLHEFQLIDQTVNHEDPSHHIFHLANLSKKQIVMMLTLTATYFVVEVLIAKVLLLGAYKKSRSRCQLWLDIHRIIWMIQLLSLVYNMFDFQDATAASLVYILWVLVSVFGLSIYTVGKFIKNIKNHQDFTFATCQAVERRGKGAGA